MPKLNIFSSAFIGSMLLGGALSARAIADRDIAAPIFSSPTGEEVISPGMTALPDSVWSFTECLSRAIANSPDIRRVLLEILQADQDIASARDAWLPSVGFSTSHSYSNYPSPSQGMKANAYSSSYGINASWTAWEGNARKYRRECAELIRKQKEFGGEETVRTITLSILQGYFNILYAKEAVAIAEKNLEVSERQARRSAALTQAGRSSKVDQAQMESQEAMDRYAVVQAMTNLASAKNELKKLLLLGIDQSVEVRDITFSEEEILALMPEEEETYREALAWLPSFKTNELSKDIYEKEIKQAQAGYYPSITLQGGFGTSYTSGGPAWSSQMGHNFGENIGATLSVPIFDGNQTRRAVAKAKLNALEYEITNQELMNALAQTVGNLYIEARSAKAKYISGLKQLEAAELASELADRQFELGRVNTLDLLTAHNNLFNARLELLQAKFMALLSNKTIIYYATSRIPME